jgi:hypothetical protein
MSIRSYKWVESNRLGKEKSSTYFVKEKIGFGLYIISTMTNRGTFQSKSARRHMVSDTCKIMPAFTLNVKIIRARFPPSCLGKNTLNGVTVSGFLNRYTHSKITFCTMAIGTGNVLEVLGFNGSICIPGKHVPTSGHEASAQWG